MNKNDGMNYAPVGKPQPVVREGEFVFAAAALDHGHIYGMSNGLIEAGATLKWVYDPDPAKVDKFIQQYPQARVADSLDVILADDEVRLVAGAAIPAERCALGLKAMAAGKDYFTDKAPLTTLEQLADARALGAHLGHALALVGAHPAQEGLADSGFRRPVQDRQRRAPGQPLVEQLPVAVVRRGDDQPTAGGDRGVEQVDAFLPLDLHEVARVRPGPEP